MRLQKIVNFMTPGAWVLVQEHNHIRHIVKVRSFFSTSKHRSDKVNKYSTLLQ